MSMAPGFCYCVHHLFSPDWSWLLACVFVRSPSRVRMSSTECPGQTATIRLLILHTASVSADHKLTPPLRALIPSPGFLHLIHGSRHSPRQPCPKLPTLSVHMVCTHWMSAFVLAACLPFHECMLLLCSSRNFPIVRTGI